MQLYKSLFYKRSRHFLSPDASALPPPSSMSFGATSTPNPLSLCLGYCGGEGSWCAMSPIPQAESTFGHPRADVAARVKSFTAGVWPRIASHQPSLDGYSDDGLAIADIVDLVDLTEISNSLSPLLFARCLDAPPLSPDTLGSDHTTPDSSKTFATGSFGSADCEEQTLSDLDLGSPLLATVPAQTPPENGLEAHGDQRAIALAIWITKFIHRRLTSGYDDDLAARLGQDPDEQVKFQTSQKIYEFLVDSGANDIPSLETPKAILYALWYASNLSVRRKEWAGLDPDERDGSALEKAIYRLFIVGFMIAHRLLTGAMIMTSPWCSATGLPLVTVLWLKVGALRAFVHGFNLNDPLFADWLMDVRENHLSLSRSAVIGAERGTGYLPVLHAIDECMDYSSVVIENDPFADPMEDPSWFAPSLEDPIVAPPPTLRSPRPIYPLPAWLNSSDTS